jgi:hypothetical protein
MPFPQRIIDKFWSRVAKKEPADCWEWQGHLTKGRGQFRPGSSLKNTKRIYASRFAWTVTFGEIPEGKLVLHRCDNPKCCNPDHLFIGTHDDNIQDCISKGRRSPLIGRYKRTVQNRKRKIGMDDAIEIRRLYREGHGSQRTIALSYGIVQQQVSSIVNNKIWL